MEPALRLITRRQQDCPQHPPLLGRHFARIERLRLHLHRRALGPGMLKALGVVVPSAGGLGAVPERPLDRLRIARAGLGDLKQALLPEGRGRCPASPYGIGKTPEFSSAIRKGCGDERRDLGATVQRPPLSHQRHNALAEFRAIGGWTTAIEHNK